MTYEYQPRGVCSRRIRLTLENGTVREVCFEGGCQRQYPGSFPLGGRHAGRGSGPPSVGYPLRIEKHLLPRPAGIGHPSGNGKGKCRTPLQLKGECL